MAALPIHSSCFTNSHFPLLLQFHPKTKLSIRSETPSTSTSTTNNTSPTNEPKKPTSPGLGFGSSSSSTANKPNSSTEGGNEKLRSGKRERASVIRRRTPVEKPGFVSEQQAGNQPTKEQSRNESAFVLTWLGLGAVILVEGIALAASGFLPEEWDKLFVKYLYPSFTPTVGLFIAGSVVYGVLKYLQNEELKGEK